MINKIWQVSLNDRSERERKLIFVLIGLLVLLFLVLINHWFVNNYNQTRANRLYNMAVYNKLNKAASYQPLLKVDAEGVKKLSLKNLKQSLNYFGLVSKDYSINSQNGFNQIRFEKISFPVFLKWFVWLSHQPVVSIKRCMVSKKRGLPGMVDVVLFFKQG